jgi:hypothetical protein
LELLQELFVPSCIEAKARRCIGGRWRSTRTQDDLLDIVFLSEKVRFNFLARPLPETNWFAFERAFEERG